MKRFYIHGDKILTEDNKYYCRYCDAFVEPTHFDDHKDETETNFERFQRDIKYCKKVLKSNQKSYYREIDSENLFS